MATRSKNQARRSGSRSSGTPGWVWMLGGLLIGALAFGYLQLHGTWTKAGSTLPTPDARARPRVAGSDNALPDVPERPKPKYTFYSLLPEKEVVIPDAELDAQARAEAAQAAKAASTAASAAAPGNPAATVANAQQPSAGTTPAQATASAQPVNAGAAPRYLIQAGAFRGDTEAEALKAQIALTGEVARVEVAQINGNTVHRVRMGPYPNASALAAAKQALASHGISAQAIRVK